TFVAIMRRSGWCGLLLAAALWMAGSGCGGGPGVGEITGTVTLDGEPLADATVQFLPRKDQRLTTLHDRTAKDGSFDVTPDPRTSAVAKPGPYAVTVSKFVDTKDHSLLKLGEGSPMPLAVIGQEGRLQNLVPERYLDRQASPLRVQVKQG